MLGSLFIRTKNTLDLEAFSRRTFEILNINSHRTRYSENSPGGHYVYGEVLGLRVILEEADDSDFPDYNFLLSLRADTDWLTADPYSLDGLAHVVAKHLARNGMTIARPLIFGKAGTERVEYHDTDVLSMKAKGVES